MSLKDKNFLVTGAAQGIGLGITRSIIEAGGKVAMIDINEETLNNASFDLEKKYPSTTLPLVADLTEMNSFSEAIKKTHTLIGPINGFCNSAAASKPPPIYIWKHFVFRFFVCIINIALILLFNSMRRPISN